MSSTERRATWTGVVAVFLWIASIIAVEQGSVPGENASEADYLAYVQSDKATILIGGWVFMAGCAAFLWFAVVLRSRLAAAEGGTAMFSNLAFVGAALVAAFMMLAPGGEIAAAITADEQEISAAAVAALRVLGEGFISAATFGAALLMIGSAAVARRTGIFPGAWAWFSYLFALVLVIGPIGWAALLVGLPVWIVGTSIFLLRRSSAPLPAPARP